MSFKASILAASVVMALSPTMAPADMVLGSWNMRHLGWENGKDIEKVAHIAQSMDLIALQELMDEDALAGLVDQLEAATGEAWKAMASHSLGQGDRYREHYGFVWRQSEVEYAEGAVVFLDHGDVFAREPYSAKFKDRETGQELALANLHVIYGDSVSERALEVDALADYWGWLGEVYPDTPRVLAGDFNLEPDHEAWESLRSAGASPALSRVATTLGQETGVYRNLYDNFWFIPGEFPVSDAGVIPFPTLLGLSHEEARSQVSDHAPIFMATGGAEIQLYAWPGADTRTSVDAGPSHRRCIDLNGSPEGALEGLPHIGPARAALVADGRPWASVASLKNISGLGPARVTDIRESGLLCSLDATG